MSPAWTQLGIAEDAGRAAPGALIVGDRGAQRGRRRAPRAGPGSGRRRPSRLRPRRAQIGGQRPARRGRDRDRPGPIPAGDPRRAPRAAASSAAVAGGHGIGNSSSRRRRIVAGWPRRRQQRYKLSAGSPKTTRQDGEAGDEWMIAAGRACRPCSSRRPSGCGDKPFLWPKQDGDLPPR